MRFIGGFFCGLLLLLMSCGEPAPETDLSEPSTWAAIENAARGQTVDWMMWGGDPFINDYVQNYVVPTVRDRYGVTLNTISGQGSAIVQVLMTEMEAGRNDSELDMMWINGETFFQLRQIDALYGDWTRNLPNSEYIDFDNPFIGRDFQQPIEDYELPWGNVQMALIYNSERVAGPPQTRQELADFVQQNPGRFTFDVQFTGLTFLKALLIDIAGGQEALNGDFDEQKYERYSTELWTYINAMKPYFWKEGRTFPEDVAQMHQMFANGEILVYDEQQRFGGGQQDRAGAFPRDVAVLRTGLRYHPELALPGHRQPQRRQTGRHGGGQLPHLARGATAQGRPRRVGGWLSAIDG